MPRELGCADEYTAAIHYQGGRRLHLRLPRLTACSWGRTLDDYSEASVTVPKSRIPRDCVPGLSQVRPWSHELTIYRNGGIVWQGPLFEPEENRTEIILPARDMVWWLDRRVIANEFRKGSAPIDTGEMLWQIMMATFPPGDPYNNPGISEHMRVDRVTPSRQVFPETIWPGSQWVGDVVRELIKSGIDMFTLGRKLYLIPDSYRVGHAPYRLTGDDFTDDISVIMRGSDTATEGFAIADQSMDPGGQVPPGGNPSNPPPTFAKYPSEANDDEATIPWFGRITQFTDAGQQVEPSALADVARSLREYGWPTPMTVQVPSGAALSPRAPVTIGQLVPGRPFRVALEDYVFPTSELFRLSEVEVSWTQDSVERCKSA